ncbi:MAG: His/Gly/Thr/Pro-type tRNA ligase C-terminal domain-containing protein, partial [Saprospiraceae bacterium]
WATSWGVSTRLIGGLIMTHSDDEGLVLPPKLAPIQVVIVPIPKPDSDLLEKANEISSALKKLGIKVKIDTDDTKRPGFKFAEYEMKGVPVRLGLGKRDLENNTIEVARRDTKEKISVALDNIVPYVIQLLEDIQDNLFNRAKLFRDSHISQVDTYDEFKNLLESKGGFFYCHWDGTSETEEKIKEETKATIRCIPLNMKSEAGFCMYSGKPSAGRVVFAKAY